MAMMMIGTARDSSTIIAMSQPVVEALEELLMLPPFG